MLRSEKKEEGQG